MPSHTTNRSIAAYEELRAGIIEGRWAPDEHLSTYRLSEELGMSRTPVIEALKRLEADGLLEIVPQVGCRVLPDAGDPLETFLVRAALEGVAAEVAAQRVDATGLDRLAACLAAAEDAAVDGDEAGFETADDAFHRALVQAGRVSHIERLLLGVWTLNRLQVARRGWTVAAMEATLDDHGQILAALRDADGVGARVAVEEHLRRCARDYRAG